MAGKSNGAGKKRKQKIGVALAGGGPLGGVYEIGALIALNEALDGMDFEHVDVYVGVSAGAMISSLLANGIAPEDMARVFISPRRGDVTFSPTLFMQPAYREYLSRLASVPSIFAASALRYLRNPLRRGLLESFNALTRAIPTAIFDNRPIERFLAGLFANRGYTNGFFERHHTHEYQNYIDSHSKSRQQSFVGEILSYDRDTGVAEIDVKNKFCVGDKLQLVTPEGNEDIVVDNMEDRYGKPMDAALGSGYFVRMQLPESANELGLLAKYI